jgi:flagellar biosynthetic protein FlhB
MAEDFFERTEAATPRRREEARQEGQVAYSHELTSGLLLLAGTVALALTAQALGGSLLHAVRSGLLVPAGLELDAGTTQGLFATLFRRGVELVGFLLGFLFLAGVGVGILQVGFYLTPTLLGVNWERISPASGWGRILSKNSAIRGLGSLVKIALVAILAYWMLKGRLGEIASLNEGTLARATGVAWGIVIRLAMALAGGLALVGILDYLWQRWRYELSLRMSKYELKQEMKEHEGDPDVRARLRKVRAEIAKNRMFKDVPKATMVVTNPTHLAVALRYEVGVMPAPKVVAKGSGAVAKYIVDLARRHNVPIVERKPLAQALYATVRVGQQIPAELYLVVAELLAYVYRLRPPTAARKAG